MYRIFIFLMIIILSASFPAYALVRQDKEFKVFQFPSDMIPRIDGNPADWNEVVRRLIGIKNINIGGGNYYLEVISQVKWTDRTGDHTITLEDHLYNWKE